MTDASTELVPRIVSGNDWLERIGEFRVQVWRAGNMLANDAFPEGKCIEPVDSLATQFVVLAEGKLVGACRYIQYPDLAKSHHGHYYQAAGITLEGPIGIPEHTVVHPDFARQGIGGRLATAQLEAAIMQRACFLIIEAAPAAAAMLRKRGRESLGKAPPDARFPAVDFEWFLTDIAAVKDNVS